MADEIREYKVNNLKIKINRNKCTSCGVSTYVAPNTFELGEDGINTVKPEGPYDNEETIREAQLGCPCIEEITAI